MDNYEVNILRRDGNWKKINPNDFLLDTVEKNELKKNHNTTSKIESDNENQDDFLYYLNQVNIIISIYIALYCNTLFRVTTYTIYYLDSTRTD